MYIYPHTYQFSKFSIFSGIWLLYSLFLYSWWRILGSKICHFLKILNLHLNNGFAKYRIQFLSSFDAIILLNFFYDVFVDKSTDTLISFPLEMNCLISGYFLIFSLSLFWDSSLFTLLRTLFSFFNLMIHIFH